MKKNEVILKKDVRSIEHETDSVNNELERMQSNIVWFNSLHYTDEILTIDEAKKYLTDPVTVHENAAIEFLKTKVQELPPNLQPLKESWNISEVSEFDFSESEYFDLLELDADGNLFYPQSVYDEIEAKHTVIASKAMENTLTELNRTWENLEKISEILFPDPGVFREQWIREAETLLRPLFYRKPIGSHEDGTATRWDVSTIEMFSNAGFGQKKV